MEPTDAELVRQARLGNTDAFARLVGRHERSMLVLAYARTKCAATAADVVQDSVLRCWRKLAELRDADRFVYWLGTTVRHLSVNALRSPARRMQLVGDDRLDHHPGDDPTQDVVRADQDRRLREAIAGLDEPSAAVLMLKYFDNLSSKQIAELLDLTPAAVDMRLTRARQALKWALAGTDLDPKCPK